MGVKGFHYAVAVGFAIWDDGIARFFIFVGKVRKSMSKFMYENLCDLWIAARENAIIIENSATAVSVTIDKDNGMVPSCIGCQTTYRPIVACADVALYAKSVV